jgi:hypothetical protein
MASKTSAPHLKRLAFWRAVVAGFRWLCGRFQNRPYAAQTGQISGADTCPERLEPADRLRIEIPFPTAETYDGGSLTAYNVLRRGKQFLDLSFFEVRPAAVKTAG